MTTTEWEARWIKVLTDAGMSDIDAREAFNVCYGNQDIDIRIDPTKEAKCFLPNKLFPRKSTDFANG